MVAANLIWASTKLCHVDIEGRLEPLRHKRAMTEGLHVFQLLVAKQNGYAITGKCADIGENFVRI